MKFLYLAVITAVGLAILSQAKPNEGPGKNWEMLKQLMGMYTYAFYIAPAGLGVLVPIITEYDMCLKSNNTTYEAAWNVSMRKLDALDLNSMTTCSLIKNIFNAFEPTFEAVDKSCRLREKNYGNLTLFVGRMVRDIIRRVCTTNGEVTFELLSPCFLHNMATTEGVGCLEDMERKHSPSLPYTVNQTTVERVCSIGREVVDGCVKPVLEKNCGVLTREAVIGMAETLLLNCPESENVI